MSNWTQADVDRVNARRQPTGKANRFVVTDVAPKRSKYRAERCIVTDDLTLFTESDIGLLPGYDLLSTKLTLREKAHMLGVNGQVFSSTKEGKRYIELRQWESAGLISELETQPVYRLHVAHHETHAPIDVGKFTPDFRYIQDGFRIVEDTKSPATKTEAYNLRKAMCEAEYGISILET